MKHSDFPYFQAFATGAFQANSGGACTDDLPMQGSRREYARAEAELQALFPPAEGWVRQVSHMGALADEGYTLYYPTEQKGRTRHKPCFAWTLLTRYY